MKLLEVDLSKQQIQAIPENDRVFFITLGHITNEINALSKFAYWSASTSKTKIEENGQLINLLLFTRLLAGKLNEAWQVYQTNFFGIGLSKIYEPLLDTRASDALSRLKQYFGKKNHVHDLRNVVSFHYSPKEIDASLDSVNEPLKAYLDGSSAPNNLFFYTEQLVAQTVISLTNLEGSENPIGDLSGELFSISADFVTTADGLMDAILKKNAIDPRSKASTETDLDLPVRFEDISIPWFSNTSVLIKKIST